MYVVDSFSFKELLKKGCNFNLKSLQKPGFGGRLGKKQENLKKTQFFFCGRRNGLKLQPP